MQIKKEIFFVILDTTLRRESTMGGYRTKVQTLASSQPTI